MSELSNMDKRLERAKLARSLGMKVYPDPEDGSLRNVDSHERFATALDYGRVLWGEIERTHACSGGAKLIKDERLRQVSDEGYDAAHDARHVNGELAWAATCYAAPHRVYCLSASRGMEAFELADPWPFDHASDRRRFDAVDPQRKEVGYGMREERIRELAKAGALIAAEIDRLERLPPEELPF